MANFRNFEENSDKSDLRNYTWYIPEFPELLETSLLIYQAEIDILIMTATEIELKYVLSSMKPFDGKIIKHGFHNNESYFIGRFGNFVSVVSRCDMGTVGISGATLATDNAINLWKPKAVFMPGIAFGKDSQKQHSGQVLVATAVVPYERQREGKVSVSHAIPYSSHYALLNLVKNKIYNWKFILPNGEKCSSQFGQILSGNILLDNKIKKDRLFKQFPACIGGEMEGIGLYAAAHKHQVPCLLVKAICDWGDGEKNDLYQDLAAATSVSFLHHVLTQSHSLKFGSELISSESKNSYVGGNIDYTKLIENPNNNLALDIIKAVNKQALLLYKRATEDENIKIKFPTIWQQLWTKNHFEVQKHYVETKIESGESVKDRISSCLFDTYHKTNIYANQ